MLDERCEPLDRGYLTFFHAPRSYTGEPTAEISTHASPVVLESLLAAALASCLDSTLRIIANRLDIKLIRLSVTATGEVDVRGTLMVSPDVPVGFQHFQLAVDIEAEPDTAPAMLKALLNAAEASCVVMQTLRNGVDVCTDLRMA